MCSGVTWKAKCYGLGGCPDEGWEQEGGADVIGLKGNWDGCSV